jgi:hypothetical protein
VSDINLTRGDIAEQDFRRHNPASGSTQQTFSRLNSTGGTTGGYKALCAASIPMLDAALVSGARSPFEPIADTQAAKHVEACVMDVRKKQGQYYNFEAMGGIPGFGIPLADASKNTELLNYILAQIVSDLRPFPGILFPGFYWEFAEVGGNMPTFNGIPNLVLTGSAYLRRNDNASINKHLLNIQDCPGFKIIDLSIDRNLTTGSGVGVRVTASAEQEIGGIYFVNTKFLGGNANISMEGDATHFITGYWIKDCQFVGSSGVNVEVIGGGSGHIIGNEFLSSGTGILKTSAGGAMLLGNSEITGNVFRATGQGISVSRTGTYSSGTHRGLTLRGNKMANGVVSITGVNQVEISSTQIDTGNITVTFDSNMTTGADRLKLLDNDVSGSTSHGISVIGSSCTLTGFQIRGGTIRNCNRRGISMTFSTGVARGGSITDVSIIDVSRENLGTLYDGITLVEGNASGGVQDTTISNNVIRNYSTPKIERGIDCPNGGGLTDRIIVGTNFIKGWNTADVRIRGAGSLDVAAIAGFGNCDGGTGV